MASKSRTVFAGVACGVAALWLWRVLPALVKLPRVPDLLDPRYARDLEQWPSVTVVVPAKDEEEAIEASLQSLLGGDYPALKVIAVDDRSTDATGVLMDQFAQEAGAGALVRVLHIQDLPDGWMGKPHAMALAAELAETDWLLFTDADVIFAPDALRRAIAFAEMSGADHCVVYPTLILERWTERMLIAFFQSMSALGGRPWKVPDPGAQRDYIGVGAFNLIRRSVYEVLGGYAELRMEVLEDLRLGYRVKRSGFRQRVAFGRNLVRIRWARNARGILRNLIKNMYAMFRFRTAAAGGAVIAGGIICLVPFAALGFRGPARWAGATTLAALTALNVRYWPQTRISPLYLALFPLASCAFLGALAGSTFIALWRGGVLWRGTLYSLDDLRREAGPLW